MSDLARCSFFVLSGLLILTPAQGFPNDGSGPETDIRVSVAADAARDLEGMSRLAAHGDDATGDTNGGHLRHSVIALRESGVLEKQQGRRLLTSWDESLRAANRPSASGPRAAFMPQLVADPGTAHLSPVDLSGEWEILEVEDDKRYKATLDKSGNGPYTQHGGRFTTTKFADRLWQGTWQQPGNDREGGFELLLSEDGTQAKGVWWYSRVGTHKNIPPREHGGTYQWKRLTQPPRVQ